MKVSIIYVILLLSAFDTNGQNTMKRNTISLNGIWQIAEGKKDIIPDSFNHTIQVPGLVSLSSPAFKDAGPKVKDRRSVSQTDTLREAFWYRRTFTIKGQVPAVAMLKIVKAMFGTKVFLNGKDVGEHLPCFTPGFFNLKNVLKTGENELIVRVGSCRNSVPLSIPNGFDFEKDHYIPGIYDNVELVLSGTPNIIRAQTSPDIIHNQVRVRLNIGNPDCVQASKITFIVKEVKSQKVAGELSEEIKLSSPVNEENIVDVKIPVRNCHLWSPEDPFLYHLEIKTEGDEYKTRFGMREFRYDTIAQKAFLNGKPYFMRGSNVTLYRFFEDENCKNLPWNPVWVRNLHKSFKQFHWNSLRYCIGLPPEEWYRIADEEGFLIQDEFPIWYGGKGWCKWPGEITTGELSREYTEWMQENWNYPSVVIWDASNETVCNDGKTDETAEAVSLVRSLDLSNRPWDNSYSSRRATGDVLELHPYHFSNANFKLKDIAKSNINPAGNIQDNKFLVIVNEYGWLWLNRDGSPTTLTKDLYKNLLGENSTETQRRHLYATYLAAETEFWRCHRKCAAVLHFTALGYSRIDGQTSDHFINVEKLEYDREFLKYMPDAFSPVALMLDEWGNEIKTGNSHSFKIIAINDLEPEWKGKIHLQIKKDNKIISEQSSEIVIPSFGEKNITVSSMTPQKPGIYTVAAILDKKGEKQVKSIREIPFN